MTTKPLAGTSTVPLNSHEIDSLLLHCFRMPQVFTLAKENIRPEHFDSIVEPHYQILWKAAQNVANVFRGHLPLLNEGLRSAIEMQAYSTCEQMPMFLTEDQRNDLFDPEGGLIAWCCETSLEDKLNKKLGLDLLRKFLLERDAVRTLQSEVSKIQSLAPVDLPEILQRIAAKVRRIENVNTDPVESAAPNNEESSVVIEKFSTGVTFLDFFMNGGQVNGEVYGILGPTGVGKTLLGAQICVCSAINELSQKLANPEYEPRHWYYFTYEAPGDEVRRRMMALLSQIPINRLESVRPSQLNKDLQHLEEYELVRFKREIAAGTHIPECVRYANAHKQLGINCWVINMSGNNSDDVTRGEGYVAEIQAILQAEKDKGRKIGGYVVDYAGKACKRHMMSKNINLDKLRHYVSMMPDYCHSLLSGPFNCPGWILHQFNTEANKRSSGAIPHHAYAAEAGNFAENLWFVFCLGTKHIGLSTCLISCSKSRRAASQEVRPVLIEGEINRMSDNENVSYDSTAKTIITKQAENVISAAPIFTSPPRRRNTVDIDMAITHGH